MVQHKSSSKTSLRICQNRIEAAQGPLLPGSACKMPVMGKEEFGRCCWLLWDGLHTAGVCTVSTSGRIRASTMTWGCGKSPNHWLGESSGCAESCWGKMEVT